MKQRKLLALGMATVMTMSSTVMVFAADSTTAPATGTINGSGTLEGFIDKDVFTVTLPTTSDLNFKIDPQELMLVGESSATVDGATIATGYGDKALFYSTAGTYTTNSAPITVINKSTFGVDVKIDAALSGLTKDGDDGYDIKVLDASADNFAFGKDTAITMAITPATNTIKDTTEGTAAATDAVYLTSAADGISTTIEVAATTDDAYEVKGAAGNYTYGLKDDVSAVTFNEAVFTLSGTVNTDADWTNFSKDSSAALSVSVTYTVDRHSEDRTPSGFAKSAYTMSLADGDFDIANFDLGAGTGLVTVNDYKIFANVNGQNSITDAIDITNSLASYANNTVTFTASACTPGTYNIGIYFNDDSTNVYWTTLTVTE